MRLAIFFVRFLKGSQRFALAPYLNAQSQINLASALTENQLSRQTLFVQLAATRTKSPLSKPTAIPNDFED